MQISPFGAQNGIRTSPKIGAGVEWLKTLFKLFVFILKSFIIVHNYVERGFKV